MIENLTQCKVNGGKKAEVPGCHRYTILLGTGRVSFQSMTELTDFSDTHKVDDFKYMKEIKNKSNCHVLMISLNN